MKFLACDLFLLSCDLLKSYCNFFGTSAECFEMMLLSEEEPSEFELTFQKSEVADSVLFGHVVIMHSHAMQYDFDKETADDISFMICWASHYGYVRGRLEAIDASYRKSSPGGVSRSNKFLAEKKFILKKCDEFHPNWRSAKKPSAEEMAENLLGLGNITLSQRSIASVIRKARLLQRATHNAQDVTQ